MLLCLLIMRLLLLVLRLLLILRLLVIVALLLGRRSEEWFATRWSSRSGGFADRLNGLPKYVVSSTLQDPKWTNVTVLAGQVADEVAGLKQRVDGDIVVYGSYQLGRELIEHDLVDELRLIVFPVAVGDGERLFGNTTGGSPIARPARYGSMRCRNSSSFR